VYFLKRQIWIDGSLVLIYPRNSFLREPPRVDDGPSGAACSSPPGGGGWGDPSDSGPVGPGPGGETGVSPSASTSFFSISAFVLFTLRAISPAMVARTTRIIEIRRRDILFCMYSI